MYIYATGPKYVVGFAASMVITGRAHRKLRTCFILVLSLIYIYYMYIYVYVYMYIYKCVCVSVCVCVCIRGQICIYQGLLLTGHAQPVFRKCFGLR